MSFREKVLGFIALVCIFSCGSNKAVERDIGGYLLEYKGDSIVALTPPDNFETGGTGFVVQSPNGAVYTATNAHVCGLAVNNTMTAHYRNGERINLTVLKESDTTDLCLLTAAPHLPVLKLANSVEKYGRMNVLGHPLLRKLTHSDGHIVDRNIYDVVITANLKECDLSKPKYSIKEVPVFFGLMNMKVCVESVDSYDTSIEIWPGNSGSPALNDNGDVVGVAFAGDNKTHWGLVIPLEVLRVFMVGL